MGGEQDHSVIISGASRGIGRQIAVTFVGATDYALILVARTESGLEETREWCKKKGDNQIALIPADLSDSDFVANIQMPDGFPAPKIIVNNAGSFLLKPLSETRAQEFATQIQSNLYSAVNLTNRFLDDLKRKSNALIINICSVGALEGLKDSGAYSASKHALLGYSRSLRQELLETEVGVTAINLGQTQSTSWEGSSTNPDCLIDPEDVANIIICISCLSSRTVIEEILVKPQHGRVSPI